MDERERGFSFSYNEFEELVRDFAASVPRLLLRHTETAKLAFDIEKLQLAAALESRFTVAIIGQMRIGKSTLLNALIGRKLAPVGVNETTATINWFRYDAGELCNQFRVSWKDGSTDDLPLDRIDEWVGAKENTEKTRWLDFFANSEFLQTANIVDTPGTRSVLEHHEQTTQGFLAEKCEAQTLEYGGRADAVVYVINPVAREDDRKVLQDFEKLTRFPGASAYNSIAVVQKWEHLEPDPVLEAVKKCDRLRVQLQGKVAEVFPVSGLLANTVAEAPEGAWAEIARLATGSPPEAVQYLLRAPSYFCEEKAGAALDCATRAKLSRSMEWPALRFCMWLAQLRELSDGERLRQAVLEASNLERLKAVLRERFFSRASLIKASTVLRKAYEPCESALLCLRELVGQRARDLDSGEQSEALLRPLCEQNPALASVLDYVARSRSAVHNDLNQIERTREELDRIKNEAARHFHFLDDDIACLERLESMTDEALAAEERAELYRLFGGHGPYAAARLGLSETAAIGPEAEAHIWDRHEYWMARKSRASGEVSKLCEHATNCLSKLLDHLEEPARG